MWMALHKGMKTKKQRSSEAILEACCHNYLSAAENFIKLLLFFSLQGPGLCDIAVNGTSNDDIPRNNNI